jgi:hypothetical protein
MEEAAIVGYIVTGAVGCCFILILPFLLELFGIPAFHFFSWLTGTVDDGMTDYDADALIEKRKNEREEKD